MDRNAIIALILIGTFIIVIALIRCLHSADSLAAESRSYARTARTRSRVKAIEDLERREGGVDIRGVLEPEPVIVRPAAAAAWADGGGVGVGAGGFGGAGRRGGGVGW